jgi:hypothetical protein
VCVPGGLAFLGKAKETNRIRCSGGTVCQVSEMVMRQKAWARWRPGSLGEIEMVRRYSRNRHCSRVQVLSDGRRRSRVVKTCANVDYLVLDCGMRRRMQRAEKLIEWSCHPTIVTEFDWWEKETST